MATMVESTLLELLAVEDSANIVRKILFAFQQGYAFRCNELASCGKLERQESAEVSG